MTIFGRSIVERLRRAHVDVLMSIWLMDREVNALTRYRCYFLVGVLGFAGSEDLNATSDIAAIERAATLTRRRGYHGLGFELWQGRRLILRQPPFDR